MSDESVATSGPVGSGPVDSGPASGAPGGRGVVRASVLMAFAALASRITGLMAKIVVIAVLSFNVVNDSYTLANTLPNIVFELLIGGVLTSVAIPLLARAQRSDADGGAAYTQQLVTLAMVGLTIATGLAVAAAPLLTKIYLSADFAGDPLLATHLAYLLLPQIFFYGVAALFGAILNSKEHFAAPAWSPVANNLLVITMALGLLLTQGGFNAVTGTAADGTPVYGDPTTTQFLVLGLGTTAGIVVQAAVLLPALRRSGFRFRWRFGWDRRMTEASGLAGWAVLYVLVSQVGYTVSTKVASRTDGGISTLFLANLLFQTPYGILGVSVLTAVMPRLSRHAAAGQLDLVKDDVSLAGRLSAVALLPVTAGVLALSGAIGVAASFYGKVDLSSALRVGTTFAALAIGLLPLALTLIQMRVFYAMKDGRTPVLINGVMVAVRVPLIVWAGSLDPGLVLPGIALATALSYAVGAVVGEFWLRHRFGPMGSRRLLSTTGRMLLVSAAGAIAAWAVVQVIWQGATSGFVAAVAQCVIGGTVGITVILVGASVAKVAELDPLLRRLRAILRLAPVPAGTVTQTDIDLPDLAQREQVSLPMTGDRLDLEAALDSELDSGPDSALGGSDPTSPTETDSPPSAVPAMGPGTMVGARYRLVSLVAVDGVGNHFWRAKDTVLPRDMAVTLLPAGAAADATVAGTLRAGRLHHIGLPQTLDLGTEPGFSYVVGQWVDGATLTDLLAGGPLESSVASSITGRIADAVEEAHRQGIALGAVHPSLVRVNFDGQVRLSHVIAYPGARPDQDIRAIGALLYLMLTATFPLPQRGMSPALPVAPTSGGRELPADEVRSTAAAGLTTLAERSLHPDGSHGVRSAGAIASLLQTTPVTEDPGVDEGGPSVLTAGQVAERRLMRERRVKLAVAGVMLLALTVLLSIVVGTVVKRAVESVQDPVITADQPLDAAPSALPPTRAGGAPESGTPDANATAPATPVAAEVRVPIVAGEVYDPEGKGEKDYTSYVDRAFDPDPTTAWQTFAYFQQFGPTGLKQGVGLMLTLDHAVSPTTVTIATTTPGMKVQVRASTGDINAPLTQTKILAETGVGEAPAAVPIAGAPSSRFLILFVTGLTGSGRNWEATISDIQVSAAG